MSGDEIKGNAMTALKLNRFKKIDSSSGRINEYLNEFKFIP